MHRSRRGNRACITAVAMLATTAAGVHAAPPTVEKMFAKPELLYVSARRDGDRSAIYEYDVDAGRWGQAIVSHPDRDLDAETVRFVADYQRRKLLGLRYIGDRPSAVWFDAEWARIQKSVDTALPLEASDVGLSRASRLPSAASAAPSTD